MFRIGLFALLLLPSFVFSAEKQPASTVEIKEWPVPWKGTRPRDPYVAPDGKVWFVGQQGDYVAEFNPDGEKLRRFDLEKGTGPHNLIVDDSGVVWYAGNKASHIGRIDPGTGKIEKMPTPEEASDPHTMMFDGIGHIWFSSQHANSVGRMRMASGKVDVALVTTPRARPYGLVVDQTAGGRPWVALLGTHKLATVEPATMKLTEIELPRKEARPKRLALTADGRLWYVDSAQGYLGVYDPKSGNFKEWPAPSGADSEPYAMAADRMGRIWFAETGVEPNRLVGFDPKSEAYFSLTNVPSGAGSVRHMVFDAKTNALWFGTDENTLGRAQLPE
jgi:virginiamycin B lyase